MADVLDGMYHAVFQIDGDGNCLFASLAHIVYGTASRGMEVRHIIVDHVVKNWNRFKFFSITPEGQTYKNVNIYTDYMSRRESYGTSCELQAAAEVFPYIFEVWRNGTTYYRFGNGQYPVRRLRFSGDLSNGHFDVYEPALMPPELPSQMSNALNKPTFRLPQRKKSYQAKLRKDKHRKRVHLINENLSDRMKRLNNAKKRNSLTYTKYHLYTKMMQSKRQKIIIASRNLKESEEDKKKDLKKMQSERRHTDCLK